MATKRVTPDVDEKYATFVFADQQFAVRKRFKVGRFLKRLTESPVDAIEIALEEGSYERFLDLEMSMDDLKEFLENLSNAMSGTGLKN